MANMAVFKTCFSLILILILQTVRTDAACSNSIIPLLGITDNQEGPLIAQAEDTVSSELRWENGIFTEVLQVTYNGSHLNFETGSKFKDFLDIYGRVKESSDNLVYTCSDGEISRPCNLYLTDTNNRPPVFEPSELSITIPSNWDRDIPINWEIILISKDADFEPENANLILTSDGLKFEIKNLWNDGDRPQTYDRDIKVFLQPDAKLDSGLNTLTVKASDGVNEAELVITIEVQLVNISPPKFENDAISYREPQFNSWPTQSQALTVQIAAVDPDAQNTPIIYSLENSFEFLTLTPGSSPPEIKFNRPITPDDKLPQILIGEIKATEDLPNDPKSTSVPLILEFPQQKALPVFTANRYPEILSEWPTIGYIFSNINFDASNPDLDVMEYKLENHPPYLQLDSSGKSLEFISIPSEDSDVGQNNVVIFDVIASVEGNPGESVSVPVIIFFPPKSVPTVTLPKFTETWYPHNFAGWPVDISTPILQVVAETPDANDVIIYSLGAGSPSWVNVEDNGNVFFIQIPEEGTVGVNNVVLFEIIATVEGDASRIDTTTIALTFPIIEGECTTIAPSTSEPCPSPSTSNPGECETCPEPVTCSTEPTDPTSCPPPVTCSTESTDPTSCPPPVTCSTEPTDPTSCPPPVTCSTEPTVSTPCPPPVTCSTESVPCITGPTVPTTCPPPVTCPVDPTCQPCDFSTLDPSTGTCAPCTTISPTTCAPCSTNPTEQCSTSNQCPECPTTPASDCSTPESAASSGDSNTGLIAGIAVVSVALAGTIGIAGYLFWKLRKVAPNPVTSGRKMSFDPPTRKSFSNGRDMRASFAEPESRFGRSNSGFTSNEVPPPLGGSQLQEVVSHPEPSASATNPSVKSALAKPKEIDPDYDEGMKKSEKLPSKARSGVKIADEVEIIDDTNELIQNSDSEEERL